MNPTLIDNMSWEMAEVYGSVVDRIIVNIAKYFPYIGKGQEPKDLFEYQVKKLAELGKLNAETVDIIAGSLDGADAALRESLEAAIRDALKTVEPELRKASEQGLLMGPGLTPPELAPSQMQAFQAFYRQSADKLNLVNTVMLESTEAAYRATVSDIVARVGRTKSILNAAAGEVVTGVSAWNTAMHDAVKKMSDNGLTGFIDHAGRRWEPEAYVAMDIRTTLHNTANAAVWERAEEYGSDIYQVSSHPGARPLCYPWQGKLLSRTGNARDVEDLDGNVVHVHSEDEVESFNYGGGLFGVNCRHYPTPFIPGYSSIRARGLQEPEENAKLYEQTQQQRGLERALRKEKRDLEALKAQGAPPDELKAQQARVREANRNLSAFCAETGLPRRKSREYTPINASFPPDTSYDPSDFPTATRDAMNQFFRR